MAEVYTYVSQRGNSILSRGYNSNGSRFNHKTEFSPTLYVDSKKGSQDTEWSDLFGNPMYEVKPGSISDCREMIERYKDVSGFSVHGMTSWVSQFISEMYSNDINMDMGYTRIYTIDIETTVELGGFPKPEEAGEEILLITLYDSMLRRYVVYTSKDVEVLSSVLIDNGVDPKSVVISKHENEYHLLKNFVIDWANAYPDALTGWNTETFDIPYLVRRITKILGESFASRLSPWGKVRERFIKKNDEEILSYDIDGINCLDYLALMKKFTYGERSSWKLGDVAEEELGQTKLEIEGTFKDGYTHHWDMFVCYNIIDVHLVKRLDDKLKLIELIFTVAYMARINPDEVFSPIRTWDSIIYNHLKQKKIVVPPQRFSRNHAQIAGGFVKDPLTGKHRWVVSFDLQSLYPHLMMWGNMSPDTIIDGPCKTVSVDNLLQQKYDLDFLKNDNVCMAANGHFFRKDKHGFLPELMDYFYNYRSKVKKEMLKKEQELQNGSENADKLSSLISSLNSKQMAVKILINACYGATASPYFRYFDPRIAEGITLSGQLAIRWVSNDINDFLNKTCGTKGQDLIVANDTDSVVGDTKITINGEEIAIQDYFEKCQGEYIKYDDFNKNFVKSVSGDTTPSVNDRGQLEFKPVKYVMKHKVKKRLYRITDDKGNSVTVTEDHSVIVRTTSGSIESIKPADLCSEKHKLINMFTNDTDTRVANEEFKDKML